MFLGMNNLGRLGACTPSTGVPLFKWISGVLMRRVTDDVTGGFLLDDVSGDRIYAEIKNG